MMKRSWKRFVGLAVVAVMLFLTCNTSALSASAEMQYIPLPTDHDREFYATQWESIEAYGKLLDSFLKTSVPACLLILK